MRIRSVHGSAPSTAKRRLISSGATPRSWNALREHERVARRARDHLGPEVLDERELALGHPARDGDDRQTERLAAGVQPEPAGEEAVAVRVVQRHPRLGAGHRERARIDAPEEVDVRLVYATTVGFPVVPDDA